MNFRSILNSARVATPRRAIRGSQTATRRRSCRPQIETLEDRSLPSVIAIRPLGDGTNQLRITGDAKADHLTLIDHGLDKGPGGDEFDVFFDGRHQTADDVVSLSINTGGGDDSVSLSGTLMGVRNIATFTGDGRDTVRYEDFSYDPDTIHPDPTGPNILIDTGGAADDVEFRPIFHPPNRLAGMNLTIRTGDGRDRIEVEDVGFAQREAAAAPRDSHVSIDAGGDNDVILLCDWHDGGDNSPVFVNVNGGPGDDFFTLHNMDFGGAAYPGVPTGFNAGFKGGSGNDRFSVYGAFAGLNSLRLDAGVGFDTETLQNITCSQKAPASIAANLGPDDDRLLFNNNNFSGDVNLNVTGGAGADTVAMHNNHVVGVLRESAALGIDPDPVSITGNLFDGGLELKLDTGLGNDRVTIGSNSIQGPIFMSLNLGGGDDTVSILVGLLQPAPQQVFVAGGAGMDTISVFDDTLAAGQAAAGEPAVLHALGGADGDHVSMNVMGDPSFLSASDLLIDGGAGSDFGKGSAFVKLFHIEK